jgi:hypothetical protein
MSWKQYSEIVDSYCDDYGAGSEEASFMIFEMLTAEEVTLLS